MTLLCKCGRFKTTAPFKSSITKEGWTCDFCRTPRSQFETAVRKQLEVLELEKKITIVSRLSRGNLRLRGGKPQWTT